MSEDISHLVARRIPWSTKFSDGDYVTAADRGLIAPRDLGFILRVEWWALGRLAVCVDPEQPDSVLVQVKVKPWSPTRGELAAVAKRFLGTTDFDVMTSDGAGGHMWFLSAD